MTLSIPDAELQIKLELHVQELFKLETLSFVLPVQMDTLFSITNVHLLSPDVLHLTSMDSASHVLEGID